MKNVTFVSLSRFFEDIVVKNKMVMLGNSFELLVLYKRIGYRLVASSFSGTVKLSKRLKQGLGFVKYVLIMSRRHGSTTTVSYLKACQLALQKSIAGTKCNSLRDIVSDLPLPRLTRSGLPRFIPLHDRRAICSGSPSVIRFWLTLFSLYRVIKVPGKLKLSTITEGFTGNPTALARASFGLQSIAIAQMKDLLKVNVGVPKLLLLESASSTNKVSWLGLIRDVAMLHSHDMIPSIRTLLTAGNPKSYPLLNLFNKIYDLVTQYGPTVVNSLTPVKDSNKGGIGQLAMKDEAAGKIRVFALVDIWTQMAMRPLHLAIFDILKKLPNDGTDQKPSIKRCFEKSIHYGCSYGFDLSAATDRLPMSLQVSMFSILFGSKISEAWRKLLVDREYWIPMPDDDPRVQPTLTPLKYAVGQPMGALSSWASLALCHHLLVQLSHRRAYSLSLMDTQWWDGYELIGDDIVIFDKLVADQYLILMDEIGVPINLSKSVTSPKKPVFEFAKVTGVNGVDCSAVSWKMWLSQDSVLGRVMAVHSLLDRQISRTAPVAWIKRVLTNLHGPSNHSLSLLALLALGVKEGSLDRVPLVSAVIRNIEDRPDFRNSFCRLDRVSLYSDLLGRSLRGTSLKHRDHLSGFVAAWMTFYDSLKIKRSLEKRRVYPAVGLTQGYSFRDCLDRPGILCSGYARDIASRVLFHCFTVDETTFSMVPPLKEAIELAVYQLIEEKAKVVSDFFKTRDMEPEEFRFASKYKLPSQPLSWDKASEAGKAMDSILLMNAIDRRAREALEGGKKPEVLETPLKFLESLFESRDFLWDDPNLRTLIKGLTINTFTDIDGRRVWLPS